jgi:hypothetical protein
MTRRWECLFVLLELVAASACLAQGPSIIFNSDPPDPTSITGLSFTFGSNANGGGNLSFTNDSGQQWSSLNVYVNLPDLETITCGPGPFGTCSITPSTGTDHTINYNIAFGPSPRGGILPDQNFSINLNNDGLTNTDPSGAGDWGPDTDFNAVANGMPEPASWELCGLVLVCMIIFACWRKWVTKRPK